MGGATNNLHVQAQQAEAVPDSQPSTRDSSVNQLPAKDVDDGGHQEVTNPLVPGQPAYILETSGQLRYLGHSSTYAFTQQVLQILQHESPSNPSPEILPASDSEAYKTELHPILPVPIPNVSGLPSKGIALHFLQCIKFRTQPLFHLFYEIDFNSRLYSFYKNPMAYASANPVWYIHYLVLIAFGRALDPHHQVESPLPRLVDEYFCRALSLMPDFTYLANEPLEATELLCCIALYLQCVDHRRMAISYMGLALRMAHLYALHLDLQESIVGCRGVERGHQIWWTVYALNQKLTSNTGLPNFLNDNDIRSPPPKPSSDDEDGTAVALHVKICQLLGLSINRVYGSTDDDRKSFVSTTRMILKGAAGIAKDIKHYTENCFGEISRVAAHLELSYHQCIVLTCRPALFCLLKLRRETWRNPVAPPSTALTGLVQICVDSATRAVQILDQLKRFNLLDSFLPFDLDYCYSALFVMIMAGYIYPRIVSPNHDIQTAKDVIGTIAARGNVQAVLRKLEIERLEELLSQRAQQDAEVVRANETYDAYNNTAMVNMANGPQQTLDDADLFFDGLDMINGFAEYRIMDLADALSVGDFDLLGQ